MTNANPLQQITELVQDLDARMQRAELLEESLVDRALALENVGWKALTGNAEEQGLSLDVLREISPGLQDMAVTNPLHKRGAQLRHGYVFGRGINFTNVSSRTELLMKSPYNKSALFSVQAYETLNLALFTDGNFFVLRDKSNILTVVPMRQITGVITDPDDDSKIRYLKRTWGVAGEIKERWYPLSRYKKTLVGPGKRGKGINKTITSGGKKVTVDQDVVIYHHSTNRQAGWTWGVPDSLAAKIWAIAYSEYLTDNAKLVKALQQIAWSISAASRKTAKDAAVQVAQPGVGATAVMGQGNSLAGVGVPSAQVNFNNGQPLAAYVAASFAVPVIALIASPGATGGSYGAATTLDAPTIRGFEALQDSYVLFFEEILGDMGSPEIDVQFPNIETDPTHREVVSIGLAYEAELIHQDEARDAVLKILDVEKLHDGPPEITVLGGTASIVPKQGVDGAIPGGVSQGITDHSGDSDE